MIIGLCHFSLKQINNGKTIIAGKGCIGYIPVVCNACALISSNMVEYLFEQKQQSDPFCNTGLIWTLESRAFKSNFYQNPIMIIAC